VPKLVQGRIIYKMVPDPQGRNPKDRPLVIVSKDPSKVTEDELIYAVGITSELTESDPNNYVLLPWAPLGKRCMSKLSKKCAALCTWVAKVKRSEIADENCGGLIEAVHVEKIIAKLRELGTLIE
jgi:hypothetical protein